MDSAKPGTMKRCFFTRGTVKLNQEAVLNQSPLELLGHSWPNLRSQFAACCIAAATQLPMEEIAHSISKRQTGHVSSPGCTLARDVGAFGAQEIKEAIDHGFQMFFNRVD